MKKTSLLFVFFIFTVIVCKTGFASVQEATLLPQGTRLAIAGDSITEEKIYSNYIETYLLACAGRRDIHVFQFGWSGEWATGFAGREVNDLNVFKPTALTTCYGMNDGSYKAYDESIGKQYEYGMRGVITKAKGMGITKIFIGSPGAVDTYFFARNTVNAVGYNYNLQQLGSIDKKLAAMYGAVFVDLHTPMIDIMTKAKSVMGDMYDVCGTDGIHPNSNGQLIMAYAFLKAMGCDGNIGEIIVDMKGGAKASEGHTILSASGGKVEVESTRYPFCYDVDPKSSGSNRSILPFLPFTQELNRFTLKVVNLSAAKATVTFGGVSKEFTRAQLASGINLAAEFNVMPFDAAFRKVIQAVGEKQSFETGMIKSSVQGLYQNSSLDSNTIQDTINQLIIQHNQYDDAVHADIVPVRYTITVTALL